ncbi:MULTISPECIES: tautomerase family protein [Pseudomonas]|jgi:4-oxalocrotonate tautomerase|uniref:2-hydroxymuconate tautomerase n=1 Tax=Pseudomonas alkylphenolica TaxID=237609 RepID=A0A077F8T2_9PSED|nr:MULTISPECIES: tautomerase family protein [Pseudomonas]AIL59836.1 4-oxalocrotonate tautomerase [Pseudomonas alkylphenolica]MDD2161366.1 tautomerase family protein [Pseudomonas sp. MIL19]
MPVVNFHLVQGHCSAEQKVQLLKAASQLYSQVLESPIERVRAFVTLHAADECAVAGDVVSANGLHAPYFDFIVLEGRPLDERRQLMSGFTNLLVDILEVERRLVRGRCTRVEPQDWSIGGLGADALREQEISARAAKLGVAG